MFVRSDVFIELTNWPILFQVLLRVAYLCTQPHVSSASR
uniref:Uncharacterized protein n=1 Tax=Arundo donax TaxID=35708 RepID=A0A0A8ZX75_ARUDO